MLKAIVVLSALFAVAYGQQNWIHSAVYNSASCSEASLVIVESSPVSSCTGYTLNSTCSGGTLFGASLYAKQLCGPLSAVSQGDFGSITETFSDSGCMNVTSRSFYKQGQCVNLLIASSRFSCSGNKQSGSVSVTGCFGPDCGGLCVTQSKSVGGCTAESGSYIKYTCGYSAAPAASVVSVAAIVLAALVALLF